ncbi:MAG: Asp-tRNA(Asn)/Glu-tRNA(Gln) amidotransferase subunit GatC [Anaerolineae bacterium]|jgi:aspartyl-tRNA(Asn)/glutamyl-tRNA(Gln) amidotransferase subunit C
MRLTRDQVLHVAELAKLKLTDVEVDLFQEQLSAILAYADHLDELDTESISPTAGVLALRNVMRPDQVRPSFPRTAMLENAPDTEEGLVRVQAVLDADELAR